MLKKINPVKTAAWKDLRDHFKIMKNRQMKDMFSEDFERFGKFSLRFKDILVDYSKNCIDNETLRLLLKLAEETDVKDAIEKMFSGDKINETEGRAVLHVALRNRCNTSVYVEGKDVMPEVNAVLKQIKTFSDDVISGQWKGYTGKSVSLISSTSASGDLTSDLSW